MENRRTHVSNPSTQFSALAAAPLPCCGHARQVPEQDGDKNVLMLTLLSRYNRYLSVASRVVRRSLKDDKRLQAEKRGDMELRFAKWTV